jgi:hypothetical protein
MSVKSDKKRPGKAHANIMYSALMFVHVLATPPFMQIVGFGLGSNPLELFGWPVTTSVGWLVIEFPTRLSTRLSIRFFEKLAVGYR